MARVTVEKCRSKAQNGFELVILAALRSRELESGAITPIRTDKDKSAVLALREIEGDYIKMDILRERFYNSFGRSPIIEELNEDSDILHSSLDEEAFDEIEMGDIADGFDYFDDDAEAGDLEE